MAVIKIDKVDTDAFRLIAFVKGGRRWTHDHIFPSQKDAAPFRTQVSKRLRQSQAAYFEGNEHWTEVGAKPTPKTGNTFKSDKVPTKTLTAIGRSWLESDDIPRVPTEEEVEREAEQARFEAEQDMALQGPPPGSWAETAMLMARHAPVEGDPDYWDRWKDEMKEQDL
jgi:hypothetical protein